MNLKRISKTVISYLLSAAFVFTMFAGSGCNNAKTIEDYPEPVSITASAGTDNEDEDQTTAANNTKPVEEEEKLDEALLPEYDSLRETGVYEFNPVAVNPVFKMEVKNNPKVVRVTKEILEAVHDAKPSFELSGDLACTEGEFKIARTLAELSSPVVYCVDIDTEDLETYTIKYFPSYESDEFGEEFITGAISEEEAKEIIDAYKEVCEKTINGAVTEKDDDMQRAAKIYKTLIETFELVYPDPEEEKMDDSEEGMITESFETEDYVVNQIISGKMHSWQFLEFYEALMVQLNVNSMMVGALGQYHEQNLALLDKTMEINEGGYVWTIITYDDKSYHCDILMDKMALDSQRENFEEYESDMIFFGMSDDKRNKSFTVYYTQVFESISPVNATSVPKCEEDYEFIDDKKEE
ncbi:MAG: hypothetical protein J6X97_03250 [Lachnospiraceae bacterium]|nr:hypothetical protein [Lachnospiraceae bacterium]